MRRANLQLPLLAVTLYWYWESASTDAQASRECTHDDTHLCSAEGRRGAGPLAWVLVLVVALCASSSGFRLGRPLHT